MLVEKDLSEYSENEISAYSNILVDRANAVLAKIPQLRAAGFAIVPAHYKSVPLSEITRLKSIDNEYKQLWSQVEGQKSYGFGDGLGRYQATITTMLTNKDIDEATLAKYEAYVDFTNPTSSGNNMLAQLQKYSDAVESYFNSKYIVKTSSTGIATIETKPAAVVAQTAQTSTNETAQTTQAAQTTVDPTTTYVVTSTEKISDVVSTAAQSAKKTFMTNPVLLIGIGLAVVKIGLMIFQPKFKKARR